MTFPTREKNIILSTGSEFNQSPIKVKAGDSNSTVFNIQLISDFSAIDLTGLNVTLTIRKPDGTTVFQTPEIIDAEAGKISVTLTTQTTAVAGIAEAEVSIYGTNGEKITLFEFEFEIDENIDPTNAIESSNDIPALTEVIGKSHTHENKVVLDKVTYTGDEVSVDLKGIADLQANKADVSHDHAIADVTGLQTALDGKVDDGQVLTDVPVGAVFTDTVTTINGKTGAIIKDDIVALGIPAQDTVYTHPANHPATMITEDTAHRFVTDTEKTTWNNKAEGNHTHTGSQVSFNKTGTSFVGDDVQSVLSEVNTKFANTFVGSNSRNALQTNNVNSLLKSGFYYSTDTVNNPVANNGFLFHNQYSESDSFAMQIFQEYTKDGLYTRRKQSNVWQPWIKVSPLPDTLGTSGQILKSNGTGIVWQDDSIKTDQTVIGNWAFSNGINVYSKKIAYNNTAGDMYFILARVETNLGNQKAFVGMEVSCTARTRWAKLKSYVSSTTDYKTMNASTFTRAMDDDVFGMTLGDVKIVRKQSASKHFYDIYVKIAGYSQFNANLNYAQFENGSKLTISPDNGALLSALPLVNDVQTIGGDNYTVVEISDAVIKTYTIT